MAERCAVQIKWGTTEFTQCEKPDGHGGGHEGPGLAEFPYQRIHWLSGDRREFVGDWPGRCDDKVPGCILPFGHHGRCAP